MDDCEEATASTSEEVSDDADTDLGSASEPDAADATAKKKGRKKKKKKKAADCGDTQGPAVPSSAPSAEEKAENDRRFISAMEDLRNNASNNLWIKLGACNIYDGKARKLAGALKRNKEITLLDLSANNITDAGAQALASALEAGGAPQLIVLDLRDNPVSTAGLASLEAVQATRRDLKVESGHVGVGGEAAAVAALAEGEDMPTALLNGARGAGPRSQHMIERYFQVGNGDAPEACVAGLADGAVEAVEDPDQASLQHWATVEAELGGGAPSIPVLGSALRGVAAGLRGELAGCSLPLLRDTAPGELPPLTRRASERAGALPLVLAIAPSCALPGALPGVVGTHRVAAAEVAALLAAAGAPCLLRRVAELGLLPALLALCFAAPSCNALHAPTAQCLGAFLEYPDRCGDVSHVWRDPLPAAPGLAPAASGPAPATAPGPEPGLSPERPTVNPDREARSGQEPQAGQASPRHKNGPLPECKPAKRKGPSEATAAEPEQGAGVGSTAGSPPRTLLGRLAQAGTEAAGLAVGLRSPCIGPFMCMARALRKRLGTSIAGQDPAEAALWEGFAGSGGMLEALEAEQDGDLGGPRPAPPPPPEAGAGSGGLGGLGAHLLSGPDLLALLKSMHIVPGAQPP